MLRKRYILPAVAFVIVLIELFVIAVFYGLRVMFSNTAIMVFDVPVRGALSALASYLFKNLSE